MSYSVLNPNDVDYKLKLVILGDADVGKTSLMKTFEHGEYIKGITENTIGVDCIFKNVNNGKVRYKLHIWDTAGQERFRSIIKMYYRNNNCAYIVFDISKYPQYKASSKSSLKEYLTEWINEILVHGDKTIPIVIVGNKKDKRKGKGLLEDFLSKEEIESCIEELRKTCVNVKGYMETSVYDVRSVNKMFFSSVTIFEEPNNGRIKEKKIENFDIETPSAENSCCSLM